MIPIEFDVIVFMENETYVAYCPELDVSSCGKWLPPKLVATEVVSI